MTFFKKIVFDIAKLSDADTARLRQPLTSVLLKSRGSCHCTHSYGQIDLHRTPGGEFMGGSQMAKRQRAEASKAQSWEIAGLLPCIFIERYAPTRPAPGGVHGPIAEALASTSPC